MKKLFGTGVALVTPFTESLEVDYKALKKLLVHTAKGCDYYVVMGTTGEAATCTEGERQAVLRFVIANNPKDLPIVYGLGGNNTAAVIEAIRDTPLDGVDALLSVSPYYNKPSQEGIVRHYEAIADASPVPVLLYNVPGRTASNLTAETTLRLANHGNIIGTKDASCSLEQYMRMVKYKPKDFIVLSGDDMTTSTLYTLGGKGVISVLANAFPVVFRKMKEAVDAGDFQRAAREQMKLLEINGPMYEEGNPVGIKYVLSKMGICKAFVRMPMSSASDGLRAKIDRIMAGFGK